MKILYHHRTKSRDGQAVHIRELIKALRGRGHEVLEWALSQAGEDGAMGSEGGAAGRLAAAMPRVVYELAEHAYGPMIAPKLVRAGRELGADVLYERHALGNTAGVRASRKLGIPLLLEVNSPLAHERSKHETLVLQGWAERSEKRLFRSADRLLVVTGVLRDMLERLGVPRERMVVIPNGADLALYPESPLPERDEVVVGFTGFFRPWHGIEALIDALADGRLGEHARLLLVGDGPSRESLEARARERGVSERVQITGVVDREAIPDHVRSMDICVQPAATAWASPLKLFEYMAAGRAIVAPDQPNLTEILTHDRDAVLFEAGQPEAMAAAVARLANDGALRRELGGAARDSVASTPYTWDGNAARVAEVAAECMRSPVA